MPLQKYIESVKYYCDANIVFILLLIQRYPLNVAAIKQQLYHKS